MGFGTFHIYDYFILENNETAGELRLARDMATPQGGGGGGGGTLCYCHTYVGSAYFFGFKILNFNIFWGFQKNKFFLGMKILWIFFGGNIFRGYFYTF